MSRTAAHAAAEHPEERRPLAPAGARRPLPAGPIVPHARPSIGPDEEDAAIRVLRSGRLAPGTEAARLEGLVARMSSGADALALTSGTLALTLALRALDLPPDGVVAIPAYGCVALVHAVRAAGGRPLVCDIDPVTLALDPDDLRRRAPRSLAAVVVVHPFGDPADVAPFAAFGVPIVEDAAQAPGARRDRQPVGARGDATVFSFAPTKLLTCGGPGGALAAREPGVVRRARDLAHHDETDAEPARVNGLMGDLHAAIAAVQIGRLPEFVARRRSIAARYDEAFADLLPIRRHDPATRPVHWRYLLAVDGDAAAHIAALSARGVAARHPVWRPLHRVVSGSPPCPAADRAHDTLISLPLSPALTETEILDVIATVRACLS